LQTTLDGWPPGGFFKPPKALLWAEGEFLWRRSAGGLQDRRLDLTTEPGDRTGFGRSQAARAFVDRL
jgi:hypothetical protein